MLRPPTRWSTRPVRTRAAVDDWERQRMSDFKPGLEGAVAFETDIAEPDREGGSLRYRGVDIEDVEARVDLARISVTTLSFVAQSARGIGLPAVPQREIDKASTIVERFMIRWRGEPDPKHVQAVDAYFISAAEHGLNASTFTARVAAGTGADCAACISSAIGSMSGPLHGGAPSRVLKMLDEVEQSGDADAWVKQALDRGDRLMGFGHRVYRAEDPRARVLRRAAKELGSRRFEVAEALEKAALAELHARRPDRG